jgi:phage-related protein
MSVNEGAGGAHGPTLKVSATGGGLQPKSQRFDAVMGARLLVRSCNQEILDATRGRRAGNK